MSSDGDVHTTKSTPPSFLVTFLGVNHKIKVGIQKKITTLPIMLPFNVKFFLGC